MKAERLPMKFSKKHLDTDAIKVVNTIHKAGFEVYFVGGCVRDLLLGLAPKDFDVVTNAKPEQVYKLFKRARLIGRRFRLVHVMFSARKFIEVATFRSGVVQTAKSGVIVRDNCFGTIKEDVVRRDFSINALYYSVKAQEVIDYVGGLRDLTAKQIHTIGDVKLGFQQDPVRMIRAIRFSVKLRASMSDEIKACILRENKLLANVSPARLYEECIKLFHNEYGFEVYQQLEKYGLLTHLFPQTKQNDFIKRALLDTAKRIRENQSITPAFLFSVFLWAAKEQRFMAIYQQQKSVYLAMNQASEEVINAQRKQVSMPKWLSVRVREIWMMQLKLERQNPKNIGVLLAHPRFRIAYDFLLLRAKSINPELLPMVKFWNEAQAEAVDCHQTNAKTQ